MKWNYPGGFCSVPEYTILSIIILLNIYTSELLNSVLTSGHWAVSAKTNHHMSQKWQQFKKKKKKKKKKHFTFDPEMADLQDSFCVLTVGTHLVMSCHCGGVLHAFAITS